MAQHTAITHMHTHKHTHRRTHTINCQWKQLVFIVAHVLYGFYLRSCTPRTHIYTHTTYMMRKIYCRAILSRVGSVVSRMTAGQYQPLNPWGSLLDWLTVSQNSISFHPVIPKIQLAINIYPCFYVIWRTQLTLQKLMFLAWRHYGHSIMKSWWYCPLVLHEPMVVKESSLHCCDCLVCPDIQRQF